jgi:hypothetical protein
MSINIFPPQPQQVTFGGVTQPVSVGGTIIVTQTGGATNSKSTGRIALTNDTTPKLIHTTTSGKALVIHSITISQHITSGNQGDRLGTIVYPHTDGSSTQQGKGIVSSFEHQGTETISFPNGGLKLPAGENLYFFHDCYGNFSVNLRVDFTYSEVTP